MILSINLAILTFLSFLSNFLKYFRVGRYENGKWKANQIAGSAHTYTHTQKKKKKKKQGRSG